MGKLMLAASALLAFSGIACAASLMDLSGDDFLRKAEELRAQLNLTATQAGAWFQAESKTRALLREEKARRERLEIGLREELGQGKFDAAGLGSRLDEEDVSSLDGRRMLRKIWLEALKGLNDDQMRQLRNFLVRTLDAPATATPATPPKNGSDGDDQSHQRSGRGGHGGRAGMSGGFGAGGLGN